MAFSSNGAVSMRDFVYNRSPARVTFGAGKVDTLVDEMARQNLHAPLLICAPAFIELAYKLKSQAKAEFVGIFTEAEMHTPTHVTERALTYAESVKADSYVSIGGGSTIGLGKALSFRTGLPHICIPTTYAGSEMTPILGETDNGKKLTKSDPRIRPGTVIYDVNLTLTLPVQLSITSGINAIAHAVEALYAQDANPVIALLALEGIKVLAEALPAIMKTPTDQAARSSAQYGAWLCSLCLGSVGMALHHKLCHTLGGTFGLPHAEVHTIILPHALAYNAPAIPLVIKQLAGVLPGGEGSAVRGLNTLLETLRAPRSLMEFGFREDDVDRAVDVALSNPYYNPRKLEREPLRELIRRAYAGEEARADL